MRLSAVFFSLVVVGSLAQGAGGGATPTSTAKKPNGVAATIRTDGAMIYAKPDFDSDVLSTLKLGEKVRVSDGTIGEVAKFHKVRAGVVLGYVAEIDVQVEGKAKKRDHKRGAGGAKKKSNDSKADAKADKKKFKEEKNPILFTKYVGILVGTSEFAEEITGLDAKENVLTYGLKITGPDVLLSGPVMDVNIAFHYGAPTYYNALSKTKPSGLIVWADTLLLLPVFNRDLVMGYLGLGPMLKFSTFGLTSGGESKSLSQLDLGLNLMAGFGFKINKLAVRLEGKYMFEKRTERAFQLSLQQQF